MSNSERCCSPEEKPKLSCCSSVSEKEEPSYCATPASSCCTDILAEKPGYSINPFVCGWLDSPSGQVPQITTRLEMRDYRGRWAMRWGMGRKSYRITPGLYAIGTPDAESPLLVSANYKLSFDCLRSSLKKMDVWILVIETKGINVWCAAGKGTFGTDEIIRRCKAAQVEKLVNHRKLIVPQLGAPGVAAHLVHKGTGFSVIYGPVRAIDLPEFIAAGMRATPSMRRVTFSTLERLILTPVEVTMLRKPSFYSIIAVFLLSGIGPNIFSFSAAWERGLMALIPGMTGLLSGCVLTPVLLPWLPGRMFATKGAIMGIVASSFLAITFYHRITTLEIIVLFLFVSSISSYTAMNFTGSSTFTSPSGVGKEMRRAIPWQAGSLLVAGFLWICTAF